MENKYEEFLDRMVNFLRENNPEYEEPLDGALKTVQEDIQELVGDLRKRTFMPPRTSLRDREGINKTSLVNFMDICENMHKEPEHVMKFLLTQTGITGYLDGQQRLVVSGRFESSNFEGILKTYINDYISFF
ncbi:eukaryotic translation initiation factor 2 subunit beta-like [Papaver somniferum]|uniref:eukaryotic translation initiation factor 2 subunit beta-like n=1 Tax=Papaver somniferum TaxID=3469 RepID=UPI000E6F60A0|nr:eukaryotic translation initiation factor 2 subunit beta-like [Papaver somniferum]